MSCTIYVEYLADLNRGNLTASHLCSPVQFVTLIATARSFNLGIRNLSQSTTFHVLSANRDDGHRRCAPSSTKAALYGHMEADDA